MARRAYIEKAFTGDRALMIQIANKVIAKYLAQGLRLTLRQLYYQFVAHDHFPNDRRWTLDRATSKWFRDPNGTKNAEPNYTWLGGLISDARLAGHIDWNAIEDRGRVAAVPADWASASDLVEIALRQFRLPRWEGQEHYVELWVEKQALAGVLEPVAERFHIPLMVNKGYSSQSAMYVSAQRFIREEKASNVVLYIGDHDPSGEDMVRDVRERLELFGVSNLCVTKVALTMEQVTLHSPPPNPAKITDSRAAKYIEKYGDESWEVDALDPPTLVQLIEDEIDQYLDAGLMEAVKEQEREQILTIRKGMSGVPVIAAGPTAGPARRRASGATTASLSDWLIRVSAYADVYEASKDELTLAEFCDLLNEQTPEE